MASKATGTHGQLIIDDIGGRVYFRLSLSGSPSTFANGKSWSGTVNGVTVGGTFSISNGQTVNLGNWAVSSSQTVTLNMGATGTSGMGGPTSFSVAIDRSTVPGVPGTPTVSNITTDQATLTWGASSGGGLGVDRYGIYIATDSGFANQIFGVWSDAEETYRLPAGTLTAGGQFFARIRAENANGTGGYSGIRSFWTLPAAPSSLAVERISDSQQKLTWTRNSPQSGVVVQRSTDGGSWHQVASPNGSTLSTFTDTTTTGGHEYRYRVAAKGPGGTSSYSGTVTVYTTPAVPSAPSAVRVGTDDIRVSVTMGGYGTHLDIQDDGVDAVTALAKSSLPWMHVDPNPATPHRYRARARVASGGVGSTTLYSAWSGYSNVVQLLAAPNAPVSLAPNGAVRASDADVVFSWVHNPVDSSEQTAYEVRHRAPGGAWTTVSGTTAESVPVALPVGDVEWEARTKGAHPDWSPWSATAVFEVIDRPGVAIIQPDTTWDASTVPVEWTWFQAQSHPQSGWELELLSGGVVVESRQGDGATTEVTLNTRAAEGSYMLRVRAATGDVWSDWTETVFEVAFIPPAPPVLAGVWDESQGGVLLTVAGESYGGAVLEGGVWYTEVGA